MPDDDASPGSSATGAIDSASTVADLGGVGLSDDLVATLDRVELTNITVDDAVGLRMWLQTELDAVPVPLFADSERVYFMAPFASQDPLAGGVSTSRHSVPLASSAASDARGSSASRPKDNSSG